MSYLTPDLLKARVGGADEYVQLTDDDNDGTADPGVEEYLLTQVDAIVDAFARRAGYTVPLAVTDVESVIPFLLDIANYKARTRGNRTAGVEDRALYDDALKILEQIASGAFKLPSFGETAPIDELGFDSSVDPGGTSLGSLYSREKLVGF